MMVEPVVGALGEEPPPAATAIAKTASTPNLRTAITPRSRPVRRQPNHLSPTFGVRAIPSPDVPGGRGGRNSGVQHVQEQALRAVHVRGGGEFRAPWCALGVGMRLPDQGHG